MSAPLIGIDTNIIIRLLTRDDEGQFEKAANLVAQYAQVGPIMINPVVILETEWVLTGQYGISMQEARTVIDGFVHSREFDVPDLLPVFDWRNCLTLGHPDMADILIGLINTNCGCETTYTFDKKAATNLPGMSLLT